MLWLVFTGLLVVSGHRLLWACTMSPAYWPSALKWLMPETCGPATDDNSRDGERVSAVAASILQAEHAVLMKAANCTIDCPLPPPPPAMEPPLPSQSPPRRARS